MVTNTLQMRSLDGKRGCNTTYVLIRRLHHISSLSAYLFTLPTFSPSISSSATRSVGSVPFARSKKKLTWDGQNMQYRVDLLFELISKKYDSISTS